MASRRKKRYRREVNGIVLVNKPRGPSSNEILQRARGMFRAAKAGHTGVLDPLASGMLPVCLGEATKLSHWLLGDDKCYTTRAELGKVTDTADAEGRVIRETFVPELDSAVIESVLARFRGEIDQIPPRFSAIKVGGERLYALAREGNAPEPESRRVRIHSLECLGYEPPYLDLRVECGSGTYIRSLVEDIGEAFGCGAYVHSLHRDWIAAFRDEPMHDIEDLLALYHQNEEALHSVLLPPERALAHWPAHDLDAQTEPGFRHGHPVPTDAAPGTRMRVHAADGQFLAVAEVGVDGLLRCLRMLLL